MHQKEHGPILRLLDFKAKARRQQSKSKKRASVLRVLFPSNPKAHDPASLAASNLSMHANRQSNTHTHKAAQAPQFDYAIQNANDQYKLQRQRKSEK